MQAYVGYNTAGGSWVNIGNNIMIAKKVTIAADCLLTNVEAYVRWTADYVGGYGVALFDDVAGDPVHIIAANGPGVLDSMLFEHTAGTGDARWVGFPIGRWLVAGDDWIAVWWLDGSGGELAYDGSGSDRYNQSGGAFMADWGRYTPTTTSNKYSIRANTVR